MGSTLDTSRRRRLLTILTLMLALLPRPILAQQEAGIIGQVTDDTGAVLPGVTVTATSPALQVPQVTDVTNERGEYRLSPLPIGTYAVEYMLPGFQTVRQEQLRLTIGFQARVDVQLKVGALEESVTVSGEAPVVDVTSTTARTQLTRETLEMIPTGRNSIVAVMIQAPGARPQLDWSFTTGNPQFKVFGQLGEQWVALEGVVTSGPKTGTQGGNHYDYAAMEESTVTTVGNTAESPTKGLQINVLLKSGGNEFHGSGFFSKTGHRLESDNLTPELNAEGHHQRQPGAEPLGSERRAGRPDRPGHAMVLLLDPPARGAGAGAQRVPAGRHAWRQRPVPVFPFRQGVVPDEPEQQVHRRGPGTCARAA